MKLRVSGVAALVAAECCSPAGASAHHRQVVRTDVAPQFTPAQRQLSREMVLRWGTMARFGTPFWPAYRPGGRIWSLRPGFASRPISQATYSAQHKCAFSGSLRLGT